MGKLIGEGVKAVLFDFDDTLVATIKTKWPQHKHVASKFYGIDLTDEEIASHWGKPLPDLVCALYRTTDTAQALANNYSCRDDFPKVMFEGTIPTLRRLKVARRLIGIITATNDDSFKNNLEQFTEIGPLLDYTQTGDDTPHHKPDPRVFDPTLAWLKSVNVSPEGATYVGDGLHDMQAAIGAGFNFIGVETGLTSAQEFRDAKVVSVPGIADLVN